MALRLHDQPLHLALHRVALTAARQAFLRAACLHWRLYSSMQPCNSYRQVTLWHNQPVCGCLLECLQVLTCTMATVFLCKSTLLIDMA